MTIFFPHIFPSPKSGGGRQRQLGRLSCLTNSHYLGYKLSSKFGTIAMSVFARDKCTALQLLQVICWRRVQDHLLQRWSWGPAGQGAFAQAFCCPFLTSS